MPTTVTRTFRFAPFSQPHAASAEFIYLTAWQRMLGGAAATVTTTNGQITQADLERDLRVFYAITSSQLARFPTPRDTQIASGTIVWLGTPRGKIFLDQAERLATRVQGLYDRPRAYKMTWANEHDPYMLSPGVPADSIMPGPRHRADDEMMRTVIGWLGMPAGQQFIAHCEQQIDLHYATARTAVPTRPVGVVYGQPLPACDLPAL